MNVGQYFLIHDDTFFLMLWAIGLVTMCAYLVVHIMKARHIPMTDAPLLQDIVSNVGIRHPHIPTVYTACKHCGQHAVKLRHTTVCLSTSCRHKTLHN